MGMFAGMGRWFTRYYFAIYSLLEQKICPRDTPSLHKSKPFLWLLLTVGPVLNIRFLLEYVFFRDDRHCDGCTDFKREGVLVVFGVFLSLAIMLTDSCTSPSDAPAPVTTRRLWWWLLAYAVLSILVAIVQ
jgi:quinol-cytochrome oxidoreductase complex cytochrome b subunit